jgi:hypothetical protein
MRKVWRLTAAILICISLLGCQIRVVTNGIGRKEYWNSWSEPSRRREVQRQLRGRPRYVVINGRYYEWTDAKWQERLRERRDYLYNEAIEKGVNPHWYIDARISQSEERTRN